MYVRKRSLFNLNTSLPKIGVKAPTVQLNPFKTKVSLNFASFKLGFQALVGPLPSQKPCLTRFELIDAAF